MRYQVKRTFTSAHPNGVLSVLRDIKRSRAAVPRKPATRKIGIAISAPLGTGLSAGLLLVNTAITAARAGHTRSNRLVTSAGAHDRLGIIKASLIWPGAWNSASCVAFRDARARVANHEREYKIKLPS
jgi:hypothetical protein